MTALEAITKMEQLQKEISLFVRLMMKLESDKEFRQEFRFIEELKNQRAREMEQLKIALSKTQLTNTR